MKKIVICVVAALLAAGPAHSQTRKKSKNYCGELANGIGPYDYRTAPANVVDIVEGAHFTEEVEAGVRGHSSGTIAGDLDYTLRAMPNHHRALSTVFRAALREKATVLRGGTRPVECYFERAIRFQPNDGIAHGIYASYLYATGKHEAALEMYLRAVELTPDDAALNYNIGLAYFKKQDYVRANKYAQEAYARDFPMPALKNMLVQAGKWDSSVAPVLSKAPEEPAPATAQPAADAPPTAPPATEPPPADNKP